jgi:hypothetical protein
MADQPNPFIGLSQAVHDVFEQMLATIYRAGDWDDRQEQLLNQWRQARGKAAKDSWGWWFGELDGESYDDEAPTRDEAIARGRVAFAGDDSFWIVEARLWADNVKEGEDVSEFAEMRNRETILVDPSGISQAEAEARGLA